MAKKLVVTYKSFLRIRLLREKMLVVEDLEGLPSNLVNIGFDPISRPIIVIITIGWLLWLFNLFPRID